ncbi:MAG: hypothetical protein IKQ40_06370, partial [Lachnospiraceae bacterium]|nr:hypothetical protein [Lachnospiraceae bacterium]
MMKKNRKLLKERRQLRKIRINALTIWIIFEVLVLIALAAFIAARKVYGIGVHAPRGYTVPTEKIPDLTINDIERPADLVGTESARATGTVEEAEEENPGEETAGDVADILAGMDTVQKVDALIITTPESLCDKVTVTIAGDIFKDAYSKDRVSGLMFRENNFKSEEAAVQMLSAVHDLSAQLNGMDILTLYRGEITDMALLAARGINMYCFPPDAPNAAALTEEAIRNNMIPAFSMSLSDAVSGGQTSGLFVVTTDDTAAVADAINSG